MYPEVHALLLFGRLPPVATPDDARLRVRLAYLALCRMPLEFDSTAAIYLAEGSLLARALDAIGRYLDCGEWPHPGALNRELMAASVGPTEGARVALGGVTALVRAVDELHQRTPDLATVARRADRAARAACQANEWGAYTAEALALLETLQDRLYCRLPGAVAHSPEQLTPVSIPALPSRSGDRHVGP